MTYTEQWSEITPTDNDLASSIDDLFRSLKIDLRERLDVIFENFQADPVVPRQSAYGAKADKQLVLHGTAFVVEETEGSVNYGDIGLSMSGSVQPARAVIALPAGVTIKEVHWLFTNDEADGSTTFSLKTMDFSNGISIEVIDDGSSTSQGTQTVVRTFDHEVSADKAYFLTIDRSSDTSAFTVHGVKIVYSCPDSRSTI